MHATALRAGELFFRLYWRDGMRRILDVGSRDINGSLRSVAPAESEYLGIDMEPGNGVDIVLKDPYEWPLRDAWFDAVVSTSCFEHDEFFWLTFLEALRVLRPGGFFFINAPASGGYHGFPVDCWRFYPDSARALENWGRRSRQDVSLIESFNLARSQLEFQDCSMVFRRGPGPGPAGYIHAQMEGAVNIRVGDSKELQQYDPAIG